MTSPPPYVSVHATAHRNVTPDGFDLEVRLAGNDSDPSAATTALTVGFARIEAVLSALPPELDLTVRRGGVSLRRIAWPDREPEWAATRAANLSSRDVEQAGAIIGPFAELIGPVDGMTLDGPSWRIDRDNPVYADLQVEAVHEARMRAERYATALGGRLGPLLELADPESARGPRHAVMLSGYAAGEGIETMDFTPVTLEVEASVQARWSLVLP